MNKILSIIRMILFVILVVFNIIFIKTFGIQNTINVIYLILLLVFGLLMFKDLLKKNKINNDKFYNWLCIFIELVLLFIFGRVLLDKSFLYNSNYYMDIINSYNNRGIDIDRIKSISFNYIIQNCWYLSVLLVSILIYRKINMERKESKYSLISLICFYISICTIIPTLNYISSTHDNILWFLVLNIVLVFIEIYRLINDNHRKREWIIYISFFFNLAAFIAICINMFY